MTSKRFSIIVPCYNEKNAIGETLSQLRSVFADIPVDDYELIVVNDGSSDGTAGILEECAQRDTHLQLIHHLDNRGYGASLKSGIRQATGELICITDSDGTYPNNRLPDLIEKCSHADMVVGSRTGANASHSTLRRIPKRFLRVYASWIANQRIPDLNSGLRVFKRSLALKYLSIFPDGFSFTTTITLALLTNNYQVEFEPIDYFERVGDSKIRPIRDTLNFLALIARAGTYFAPLRVFGPIIVFAAVLTLASLGYDMFVLSNLTDKSVILLMLTMNAGMFALLADMLDKRT